MKKNNRTTNSEQQASDGALSPKGVRLISLYIGSFDSFKGQVMNFCSDYRTEVKNSKVRLRLVVKQEKVLPDNFFALNEGNEGNGCVKSVSAIIGENGAGKTTLARLLCNLPASDSRKPEWKTVLIYEEAGEVKCYSTFSPVSVELISASGKKRSITPEDIFPPYKLFYYSPHFTTEQFIISTTRHHVDYGVRDEGDCVKNISTTWLLLHPEGNSELLSSVGAQQSSIFDADEKIRLFEFIAEYKARGKALADKFDIPMPKSISVGIHGEGFQLALQDIQKNADRAQIVKEDVQRKIKQELPSQALIYPVDKYLKAVGDVFDEFLKESSQHSLVVNVFMSYAARYIQESGIFETLFPVEELKEGYLADLKAFLASGSWVKESSIKKFFKDHRPELPPKRNDKNSSPDINPMLKLIGLLQQFSKESTKQSKLHSPTVRKTWNSLVCRLGVPKVLIDVCHLILLHAATRVISPYLKFDAFPPMSSGEMCFITMFARLYHFVKEGDKKNIVVFLDEAETTLHPEWQRRLVAYCIRFFEVFLPDKNVQLIFSSHSPVLLSDIPAGNAIFLKRRDADKRKPHIVDSEVVSALQTHLGYTNTFAANIFDLYRNSFFMKEGTAGMFAQEKLNNIMVKTKKMIKEDNNQIKHKTKRMVTKKQEMEDSDWDTLELVGDPLAKRYFSSIKAILKDIRK